MKKKLLTALLCLMMSCCLISCGDTDDRDNEITDEEDEENEDKKSSKKKDKDKDSEDEDEDKDSEDEDEDKDSKDEDEDKDKDSKDKDKDSKDEEKPGKDIVAKPTSNALEDWYNSDARTALEEQINNIFNSQGLSFRLDYEDDDTIIYIYTYTTYQNFGGASKAEIKDYFDSAIAGQAETFKNELVNYKNTYDLDLTTVRLMYLNADDSVIYSVDIDKDFDPSVSTPSTGTDTSSSSFSTLEEWINSPLKDQTAEIVNSSLTPMGLIADFGADDDVLEMIYTFVDYQDYTGISDADINLAFETNVAPTLANSCESMISAFDTQYGITISDVHLIIYNSDNTLIYDVYLSDL